VTSEFPDHARIHYAAVNTASSMTKGEIAELLTLAFADDAVG